MNVRQLDDLLDGVDIGDIISDDDDSKSTAESCKKALTELRKLRKAKHRKRRLHLRADDDDDDDDDEEMNDDDDDDDMLGPESITVGQDRSRFEKWEDAKEEGASILGTYGLNSCTAVLIVGKNGGIIAHLSPIEEDGVEDGFKDAINERVLNLYNDNKDDLADAKMWVYTPEGANAEDRLLSEAARNLEIAYQSFRYAVVDDPDDDWVDSNVGTAWADFSDTAAIKVFLGNQQRN